MKGEQIEILPNPVSPRSFSSGALDNLRHLLGSLLEVFYVRYEALRIASKQESARLSEMFHLVVLPVHTCE